MTDERLKIWLGFLKFFLGSFAIGLATIIINQEFQDREIELKEMEQLGKFIDHALTEDVGVRLRFAQYFSTVTRSDEIRKGWKDYVAIVDNEYNEKKSKLASLQNDLEKPNIEPVEKVEITTKINKIESELSVPKTSRREVVSKLIDEELYEEALKIDPHNTLALMRLLKIHALAGRHEEAIKLFPRMKAANSSGVGYSSYPFAIYSFASLGQINTAKSIYIELKKRIQEDIRKGYGYASRAEQISWIQDNFRDVAWESKDPSIKLLLDSYVNDITSLVNNANENNNN